MKRKLILGMTSIVSIVLAAGVMAQSLKTIKIGEINSYSTAPQFAAPYRNGWQLALEEINAAGGINGRMLEVVPRDDEGKQDLAIRHAQNLIATEKVDVLAGAYMSNIGLAQI